MSLIISCLIQYPMVFAIFHFITVPIADIYPIIHLLPGMNEMIFAVTKQQMNVETNNSEPLSSIFRKGAQL